MSAYRIKWNNWRDGLIDASFRGVPFKVLKTTTEGGRRSVLHQFPFDDIPYWEDMGKEAGTYNINGFVVGSLANDFNYFGDRDKLKKALEEAGAAQLNHPFLGILQVGLLGKYKLEESFQDGGVAMFTMTFVDAGQSAQPAGILDVANIDQYVDDIIFNATEPNIFSKLKGYYQAAVAMGNKAVAAINSVYGAALTVQSEVVGMVSQVQTTLAQLRDGIRNLVGFPTQFSTALQNIFSTYRLFQPTTGGGGRTMVMAMLGIVNTPITDYTITETTKERIALAQAQYTMNEMLLAGCLAEAVRAAAYNDYTSYDETQTMLDDINDAIDVVLDAVSSGSQNDDLYFSIVEMRPVIVSILISKGANLPALRTISMPDDPQPALVLSERLYGTYTRDEEIINMNRISLRHPGFPKGGGDIVVLGE